MMSKEVQISGIVKVCQNNELKYQIDWTKMTIYETKREEHFQFLDEQITN